MDRVRPVYHPIRSKEAAMTWTFQIYWQMVADREGNLKCMILPTVPETGEGSRHYIPRG